MSELIEDVVQDLDATPIQRFYDGATILVTGATGFMGKVLVEKLLRSCPGVTAIYLLVRAKRGKSPAERVDEIMQSACFNRIKADQPKLTEKLYPVTGDLASDAWGLSPADLATLCSEVSVVFHVAATVRFDEHVKLAIEQNVKGTRELVRLAKQFVKIKAIIHVSTAYANCDRQRIEECFYEPPLDSDDAIQLADTLDTETLDTMTPKLLGPLPNTYTFTKAVSEHVIDRHARGLPIGVFRPGIVVCTAQEPFPGWIDNMYGPTGMIMGCAAGLIRVIHVDADIPANVVPCDLAINSMIVCAWDVARNRSSDQHIPVYNYTAPACNPIKWGSYMNKYLNYGKDWPTIRAIWYYYAVMARSRIAFLILRLFLHTLPAIIMDLGFICTGHKPQMLQIYSKIHKFSNVLSYFSRNRWFFTSANVAATWDRLEPRDKELFPFDMREINWDKYIKNSCEGLRHNIVKDVPATLEAARSRMKKLYILHRCTQFVILLLIGWIVWLLLNAMLPNTRLRATVSLL